VHVVAPILCSRIHYVASDVDAELRQARQRLDDTLAWARAEGLRINGRVGDPSIALGAIEDELRLWGADEAIIYTLPRGRSNWLETGIVERLREDLDIPVIHKVVDLEAARSRRDSQACRVHETQRILRSLLRFEERSARHVAGERPIVTVALEAAVDDEGQWVSLAGGPVRPALDFAASRNLPGHIGCRVSVRKGSRCCACSPCVASSREHTRRFARRGRRSAGTPGWSGHTTCATRMTRRK
jgi:hypothetical protein